MNRVRLWLPELTNMKGFLALGLWGALTFASACDRRQVATAPTAATNPSPELAAFTGVWSSAPPSGSGLAACTDVKYVVTPTGPTTAVITYSATCVGRAVTGSGNGTMNGSTLEWTTTGTAFPCAFSVAGTATEVSTGINVIYSGQICGLPVAGSDILHR